ncbi:hypothetical protein G7077_03325 [Sphingomonas piscis]|uniref:Uncharacterized protein n=1 Tax=Sphingomonas piscis TaxID=2714943 RepID=A0A6G7YMX7_9SPHN|nr:hypothetical protein [Sphingomonas piscis]QIK78087.1 hypothetical protein G7077_03325 [Sphingomonas piscis]
MGKRKAVFIIHLLQDVQVLRPLIFMAARDYGFDTNLLVSDRFGARDTSGIWVHELQAISQETGATLIRFGDDLDAYRHLSEGGGLLFSASESNTPEHETAHNIFRYAGADYLRVTVQHGFECVGLRHGVSHTQKFGSTASFAADILCTWFDLEQLTSLAPSQAPKVVVTGPTSVLQVGKRLAIESNKAGMVFENLHSVRFDGSSKLRQEFLTAFRKAAGGLHKKGIATRLRPHPGGRFSTRGDHGVPPFVELEEAPLYRLGLGDFAFGISPPSSVIIDMLLADLPTAVWQDPDGQVDLGHYAGLAKVSSAEDMIGFAEAALLNREAILAAQRIWIEQQGMPLEPLDVYRRFAALFDAFEGGEGRVADQAVFRTECQRSDGRTD